jgi:hypothetical protein
MRRLLLLLACSFFFASASLAEVADKELRARTLQLQKLATEVKELNRCMGIVSVEDLSAFEPIVKTYNRKTDELAKAVEEFATRYADKRGKHETVFSFRYRVWDITLQSGLEKARPVAALNRELCVALTR